MRSRTVALVPLRAPGAGKTRLATALSVEERAALSSAMLADVARALLGAPIDEVVIAADGPAAAATADALGLSVLADPVGATTLNEVVRLATARFAAAGGLVVVAADLPLLTTEEVTRLLDLDAPVVVAPTGDGGTGGFLRRPPGVIGCAYGPDSGARHHRLAADHGLASVNLDTAGFRHDVDTWTDLVGLHEATLGAATAAVLPQVLGRLAAVRSA